MILRMLSALNPLRVARIAADVYRNSQTAATKCGRSVIAIVWEFFRLRLTTGLSRQEYFVYEFYFGKSAEEQRSYVRSQPRRIVKVWERLNPRSYWPIFNDKYLFDAAARALGLPVPHDVGFFDPQFGRTTCGRSLRSATDLASWLSDARPSGLVVKPVNGIQGKMVLVFQGNAETRRDFLVTLDGREFSSSDLFAYMTNRALLRREYPHYEVRSFLFQERLRLHPKLVELLGQTLCCARVMTLIGRDGQPTILRAIMKLQAAPSGVDNMAQGSVIAPIDLETGLLGQGRDTGDPQMPWCNSIPVTGKEYAGFTLPDWTKLREVALSAAAAFPWCRCIGWDIALSDRGPVLIEANERWSAKLAQAVSGRGMLEGELLAVYEQLRQQGTL
jgi:hypothetical protein